MGARDKGELIERFPELYGEESRDNLMNLLRRLFDGQRIWEGENVYRSLTGKRIEALVRLIYVGSEGGTHTVFASRMDITELKRIERKIRNSERMLARSQAIAAIGSFEWHAGDQDTLIWSDEMCAIFGKSREDLSGGYRRLPRESAPR